MHKQILGALMLTTLLGGCSMIPDYLRPASPAAAQWPAGEAYQQVAAENTGKTAAETGWQEFSAPKTCSV